VTKKKQKKTNCFAERSLAICLLVKFIFNTHKENALEFGALVENCCVSGALYRWYCV